MRKNIYKKYIAVAAAVMMALSMSVVTPVYTLTDNSVSVVQAAEKDEVDDIDDLKDILDSSLNSKKDEKVDKEETVYVITDNNGKVDKTIVEEWLKNPKGKDVIEDKSNLKEIKNVKGEETFSEDK